MVEIAAYFVGRASLALSERERALTALRERSARTERVVSLTTLAAGAAHELSTPLATIALTARELEHALEKHGTDGAWTEDARLIRREVERCRSILDQMSGRAGGSATDAAERFPLQRLVDDIRSRLSAEQQTRLTTQQPDDAVEVCAAYAGLRQSILSLVTNAFDASSAAGTVTLSIHADAQTLRIVVRDDGAGLTRDVLERAGEPFFTTKAPGRGLGLGLFLARIFAERHGGWLALESGDGTTATLELPLPAPEAGRP